VIGIGLPTAEEAGGPALQRVWSNVNTPTASSDGGSPIMTQMRSLLSKSTAVRNLIRKELNKNRKVPKFSLKESSPEAVESVIVPATAPTTTTLTMLSSSTSTALSTSQPQQQESDTGINDKTVAEENVAITEVEPTNAPSTTVVAMVPLSVEAEEDVALAPQPGTPSSVFDGVELSMFESIDGEFLVIRCFFSSLRWICCLATRQ